MIITGKHLHRRTFLKGMGAAIALPMLDAMTPAFAAPARLGKPPLRLAFTYVPNGIALGDGPGDHARAAASYLTGVHPKKTAGADIHNGISVDQIAAQHLGAQIGRASCRERV